MQKIILSAFIAIIFTGVQAQELNATDSKAIDSKVENFLSMIEVKDYTGLLDFMYPPIFEHTSKKSMFQVFEMLEQAGIELKFQNLEVLEKTSIPSENEVKYAMVKYNIDMELPLNTDDLKGIAPLMVPMLQSNFGKENVEYNRAESYIHVKGQKFLLGVNDPDYSDWMFLIYDSSFKSALEKTLPASINQKAKALSY